MNTLPSQASPALGSLVRVVAATDIQARVVSHTRYLDGAERYEIAYWHNGERKLESVSRSEIEPVTP